MSTDKEDGYVTDEDEGAGQDKKPAKNHKKDSISNKRHKLAKELSDLVNYCVSVRFEDFMVSQEKRMLTQIWFLKLS